MKKSIVFTILLLSGLAGITKGQTFDWNIRGGLNIMNGQPSGEDIYLGYHAGFQAGVRVSYWGFYAEGLYSVHQNQDGGDPIAYLIPGINIKRYVKQFLFVDFGGALLMVSGDTELSENTLNPENKLVYMAGIGAKISVMELSMRVLSRTSYGVIQVTAALKF
jgi:hypothetical protein